MLPYFPPSCFGGKVQNPNTKNIYEETTTTCNFTFKNSVTKRPTTPPKTNQSVSKETTILNSFTLNIWFGVWKNHHGSWGSDFSLPFFVSCRWLLPSILEAQLSPPRVALEYLISVDSPRIKGTSLEGKFPIIMNPYCVVLWVLEKHQTV